MAVIEITSLEQFNKLISENPKVAVDFKAVWCGPCKLISPIFKKLAEEHKDVVFLEVDVDSVGPVAQEYQIRAMPTFKFFLNGQELKEMAIQGANKAGLTEAVQKLADEGKEKTEEEEKKE